MATLSRDGVALHYEDSGEGAGATALLVHGWACDRTSMAPLFDHLRRGRRVVSVDLRGHGESDRPTQPYRVEGFADDLAWMCRALGLGRVAVVGHSLGGSVALEMAARHADVTRAALILEGLVVAPPEMAAGFQPVLAAAEGPDWRAALSGFIDGLLGPHYEPAAAAAFRERMLATPYHVLAPALRGSLEYDSAAAAAEVPRDTPLLYVASGPWYTDVARFRSLAPQLVTAQLVGCGHYFCTEVPEQVNPIVERYLRVYVDGR